VQRFKLFCHNQSGQSGYARDVATRSIEAGEEAELTGASNTEAAVGNSGTSCAFTSFEQCMMTAGTGTGGFCVQNPWYLAYGEGRKAGLNVSDLGDPHRLLCVCS
jgi:hypothetical protein